MTSRHKQSILGSQLTTIISVTLVLTLCGIIAMLSVSAQGVSRDLKGRVGYVIELRDSVTADQGDSIAALLRQRPSTATATYTSPDQILAQEQKAMGDDIMGLLEANPYHGEIDVRVHSAWATPDSVSALCHKWAQSPQVQEVRAHTRAIATAYNGLQRATLVLGIVAILLLIIALVLINNTVSLAVYARRRAIYTMRLVGARPSFICRPYVWRGTLYGVIAGVVASALLICLQAWGQRVEPSISAWLHPLAMAAICGGMIVAGAVVCTLASWLAASRYLRWTHDDIYRK